MKTTSLIASLALVFAAGSALAQEATSDAWMNTSATAGTAKSRTQVQAELAQARADGSIKFASAGYMEKVQSRQSRADVVAAARSALANGEIAQMNAEAPALGQTLPQAAAGTRLAGSAR